MTEITDAEFREILDKRSAVLKNGEFTILSGGAQFVPLEMEYDPGGINWGIQYRGEILSVHLSFPAAEEAMINLGFRPVKPGDREYWRPNDW